MSEEDFDPFKLTSGLPLSGAEVTVTGIIYGYDAQYGAENCIAMVTFDVDGSEPNTQFYSVGKNFEPGDREQKTLVHKSGKPANLNDNSNYGRMVGAMTSTMKGKEDFMAAVRAKADEVMPVFHGDWLNGFRFKMGDLPWINNLEKDETKRNKILIVPVEFLGTADEPKKIAPAAKKLAPKAPGKTIAEAVADDAADEDFGIDDPSVLKQLIKAAKAADDFDAFTDAADAIDGLSENKVWMKAAYNSKPGSIWATYGA